MLKVEMEITLLHHHGVIVSSVHSEASTGPKCRTCGGKGIGARRLPSIFVIIIIRKQIILLD